MDSKTRTSARLVLAACALIAACSGDEAPGARVATPTGGKADSSAACTPGLFTIDVPGWPGRPYDIYVPDSIACGTPAPVVIALHGGGGNSEAMARVTCPFGDFSDPGCLDAVAERESFLLVYPNGIGAKLAPKVRTFNAGGGEDGYDCIAGRACDENIDDVGYIEDLLDDVEARFAVDTSRIYSTGLSNGGAMSYRLACEMSHRIAAIASVAGAHQVAAVQGCAPERPVPVMEIHGTFDDIVPYYGGVGTLTLGYKVSVADSIGFWVDANGCAQTPSTSWLPNIAFDWTRVVRDVYSGCDDGASVVLLEVQGGGHNWPGGWAYGVSAGVISRDINASDAIWSFFAKHEL